MSKDLEEFLSRVENECQWAARVVAGAEALTFRASEASGHGDDSRGEGEDSGTLHEVAVAALARVVTELNALATAALALRQRRRR